MTTQAEFNKRALSFITGEELANALGSITLYLEPGEYSGAHFERFTSNDLFSIDSQDLVAVKMLGVEVPASAAIRILGPDRTAISHLLRMIPPDAAISDPVADSLLAKEGPAWGLWDLLRSLHGLGRTITSKLLAAKRPALVPIYDTHVARALGLDAVNDWDLWRGFMQDPAAKEVVALLRRNLSGRGINGLTDLRLLDIVIWMRMHGATAVTQIERRPDHLAALVQFETGFPIGHPDR